MDKIHLFLLILAIKQISSQAVAFKDIQRQYLRERAQLRAQKTYQPVRESLAEVKVAGNGNDNGNCYGNCLDNNNGNGNGNNNTGSANGNRNGNCHGNCVGNENGNNNGNYNGGKLRRAYNNGNGNGNCFGNCFHNRMGNGNGNGNLFTNHNGNNHGNCKGNCFHYRRGNFFGNGNRKYPVHKPTSCVGNCFPKEQPKAYRLEVLTPQQITRSHLKCDGRDGFRYYVRPGSYCFTIHRHLRGRKSLPTRTHCAEGEVFDLSICGCNSWWFVDVDNSCTSGREKA